MIFYHKTLEVNKEKIYFKKKQKISDKFSFIPIQYEGKDFIVQTPILYIPYGWWWCSINMTESITLNVYSKSLFSLSP